MTFAGKHRAARDRQWNRAEVVAAAREAFNDLGPAASLDEIARCAGIDVAALSRHFRDRDELIGAVLDDLAASLRDDGAEPASSGSVKPRLRLRQLVPPIAAMAALLPLGAAPTAAAAAQEPAPAATVLTISPLWPVVPLNKALGGSLCRTSQCSSVPYVPFVTWSGVRALEGRLSEPTGADTRSGGGPITVFGFSNGAGVAEQWIAEYSGAPGAPSPDELSFVLIGNPRRAYGGTQPAAPPSDYHVIDIVRQYDPMADFPDHFNLLALANVAAGMLSPIHLDYRGVDLDDPANVVWTEGNTTYVFVPTPDLPLLNPLRRLGMDKLADELNEPLKEIVERAYDRPYLTTPVAEEPDETDDAAGAAVQAAAANTAAADETTRKPLSRKASHRHTATEDSADDGVSAASDASGTSDASDASDDSSSSATGMTAVSAAVTQSSSAKATPQTRKAAHKRGLLNRSTG